MKIKTIDITAKEYFDKTNGNSYFSAIITINYGLKTENTIKTPFQYGYGDQYQYSCFEQLKELKIIKNDTTNGILWRYCNENKIILRCNKITGCKKRDV